MLDSYNDALVQQNRKLLKEYKDLLIREMYRRDCNEEDLSICVSMCAASETIENGDKLSRWVGFVQGILYVEGVLSIEDMRNSTRESYCNIYSRFGLPIESVNVKQHDSFLEVALDSIDRMSTDEFEEICKRHNYYPTKLYT